MSTNICMECSDLNHWFCQGNKISNRVLYNINMKIIRGEIVSLVGPSGCGKSTLLRAMLGTHTPRQGKVSIFSDEKNEFYPIMEPSRDVGIVYQRYSLYPFLTAKENVAFGLMLDQTSIPFRIFRPIKWRRIRKEHIRQAVELLEKLGLGRAVNLYPSEMSGGMCQRVAIAQALIMKPKLLLLDEPFGALDEATREDLQHMLLHLYQENLTAFKKGMIPPFTIMIVTHELDEAIYVGDRVIALSQYWNWKEQGFKECPGATIVYDKVAPVFSPYDVINHSVFLDQKTEIRKVAFDEKFLMDPTTACQFWKQMEQGKGEGVLKNDNCKI